MSKYETWDQDWPMTSQIDWPEESIKRGLEDSAAGRVKDLGDFTKYDNQKLASQKSISPFIFGK